MNEAKPYDVFLSHNSDDKPLVEELALRLQDEAGLNPWLDAWHIPGGAEWEQEIERALGSCRTCAVILGEHGWGKYHLRESKAALTRREEHLSFRVIPVFLPGAREEDTDQLPDFFEETQWIDFRAGLDDSDALARLIAAIGGEVPYPEGRPNLPYLIRRDAWRWEQSKRKDESLLYRGDELRRAQKWASQQPDEMNTLAWGFLQAGANLEEQQRVAQERRRRQTILGLAVGLVLTLVLALLAWWQRSAALDAQATAVAQANVRATAQAKAEAAEVTAGAEARVRATAQAETEEQRQTALSRQLAAQAIDAFELKQDTELGLLLALEAAKISPNPNLPHLFEAEDTLRRVLAGAPLRIWSGDDMILNPDSTRVAIVTRDNSTIRLADVATGIEMTVMHYPEDTGESSLLFPRFSPDGTRLTARGSGSCFLWSVATGGGPFILQHGGWVEDCIFSPDETRLATMSFGDNAVRIWNPATGVELYALHHDDYIADISFDPSGTKLATASHDGTACLWDVATGTELAVLHHGNEVSTVIFSPDGTQLVTGSEYGKDSTVTVSLWDVATGTEVGALWQEEPITGALWISYSPDGTRLFVGDNLGEACLFNVETGTELAILEENGINLFAFNPNGTRLATTYRNILHLWNATTGAELSALSCEEQAGGWINNVKFNSDGTLLTFDCGSTAYLWDAITGVELFDLQHNGDVTLIDFSLDGKRLATGGHDEGILHLWDATTGAELAILRHDGVGGLVFSPDGKRLATFDSVVRLWDVETRAELAAFRHTGSLLYEMFFSPDGTRLVTHGEKGVCIWDAVTGVEPAVFHHGDSVLFSPDGKLIATWTRSATYTGGDSIVRLWNVGTRTEEAALHHKDLTCSVAFSPDGELLATASYDNTARLWDASTGTELAILLHEDICPGSVIFSPDGTQLATTDSNAVRLWDVATGRELATLGHGEGINTILFNPHGTQIATASRSGAARLWEISPGAEPALLMFEGGALEIALSPDGDRLATFSDTNIRLLDTEIRAELASFQHKGHIVKAVFSPDGKRMATASADGTAWLVDAVIGTEIAVLQHEGEWNKTFTGPVVDVVFSPNGMWLATASRDDTACLWDAVTGAELAVLHHDDDVVSVAFSPDGAILASASHDDIRLWDMATGSQLSVLHYGGPPVVFNPDGKWLAAGNSIFRVRVDDLVALACRILTRNLTHEEWRQHLGDEPYHLTCPNLPVSEE